MSTLESNKLNIGATPTLITYNSRGVFDGTKSYTWLVACKDNNNNYVSGLYTPLYMDSSTSNSNRLQMLVYNSNNTDSEYAHITVGYRNGTPFTVAPTPPTTDNSTQIATTAFVNNRLPYTTGTWTPTLSGSTTAGSFTYSYTGGGKECYYVKFGNLVFLRAAFTYTITSAPAGEVRINGAPFVSNSYYNGNGGGNTRRWHLAQIGLNSSYIRPQVYKSDLSGANIPQWGSSDSLTTWLNTVNSSDWIIFSIWYKTNS